MSLRIRQTDLAQVSGFGPTSDAFSLAAQSAASACSFSAIKSQNNPEQIFAQSAEFGQRRNGRHQDRRVLQNPPESNPIIAVL
jgi:hypothetical protein